MMAIVDFHVHLYPCFDLSQALLSFHRNTLSCFPKSEKADRVLCLVERFGECFFEKLCNGVPVLPPDWEVEILEPELSVRVTQGNGSFIIIAGRQVVVKEGFEVLGIATTLKPADGLPAEQIISDLSEEGAIPVLAWAPGKWMFSRSKSVNGLLERFDPSKIAIGDTTLRPSCYNGGQIFEKALSSGYLVLPGSDPLPRTAEQKIAGRYCASLEISSDTPAQALRSFFQHDERTLVCSPNRSRIIPTIYRILMHECAKRRKA